jgi:phosphatidylserine decarboxylase
MIWIINRQTGRKEQELVFGQKAIEFLYGHSFLSKTIGRFMLHSLGKWPFFAALYGWIQKQPSSKKKISPFVKQFYIDTSEFQDPVESFTSFNDFFIRKLKAGARPIDPGSNIAVMPADGRYHFYPKITSGTRFSVKKRLFDLETLFQSKELAARYDGGSLVMARLCPTDCHRFYFPIDCVPSSAKLINGKLYSVNPIATRDNPWIWGVNRRVLTMLSSDIFGEVAYFEVGATNVGSITQTYTPHTPQKKGDEKGYFSFGGSALLLFFEPGKISFDSDLLQGDGLEIRCLIGQSLGQGQN